MNTPQGPLDPAVICVAPNGARRTKDDHPAIPMTAAELAWEAAACKDAGAAMMHLHVRDRDGRHLLDADAYRDAIRAIRTEVGDDLIVQITTEAVGRYNPAEQIGVVKAVRPESASVAVRELVSDDSAVSAASMFFHWMADAEVVAQYILYTPKDVRHFNALRARGVIPQDKPLVLFVLGSYAGDQEQPERLHEYVSTLDEGGAAHWGICAFGRAEAAAAALALQLGGHPRVGFENNLHLANGHVAQNNAALVAQTVEAAAAAGRPVANASAARACFGMAETYLNRQEGVA